MAFHIRIYRTPEGSSPSSARLALQHRMLCETGAGYYEGRHHAFGTETVLRLRNREQPAVSVCGGWSYGVISRAVDRRNDIRDDSEVPADNPNQRSNDDQRDAPSRRRKGPLRSFV